MFFEVLKNAYFRIEKHGQRRLITGLLMKLAIFVPKLRGTPEDQKMLGIEWVENDSSTMNLNKCLVTDCVTWRNQI